MIFYVDKARYSNGIDSRTNTEYISRSEYYDLTDYHWARVSAKTGKWIAYIDGKAVLSFAAKTKEEAARMLLDLDKKAHLTPCIDRT